MGQSSTCHGSIKTERDFQLKQLNAMTPCPFHDLVVSTEGTVAPKVKFEVITPLTSFPNKLPTVTTR